MKKYLFYFLLFSITPIYAHGGDYIITKKNDTIHFDKIEIVYNKRAVCYKNGIKKRYSAGSLIEVSTNGDIYHAGRIVPLVLGWKRYLLLYRHPPVFENQEILQYQYNGPAGGSMSDGLGNQETHYVTTSAVRNANKKRGNFGKMVWPVWRHQIKKACESCSEKTIDLVIMNPDNQDPDKIVEQLNEFYSGERIVQDSTAVGN